MPWECLRDPKVLELHASLPLSSLYNLLNVCYKKLRKEWEVSKDPLDASQRPQFHETLSNEGLNSCASYKSSWTFWEELISNENFLMHFLIYPTVLDGKSFKNSSEHIKMSYCPEHLLFSPLDLSLKWMLWNRRSFWITEQLLKMSMVNSLQIPHYQ